ncbi:MAG TPA: class I SAM-dependent methyltransferase [Chlamydiales bacterium]|nr:class I SAM-dependent methyltransferase [Chlamydiales bacterium]
MDIQPAAIETTRLKVPSAEMYLGCHSQLPEEAFKPNLKLITYNLGYLPGGDKTLTTKLDTTLESLKKALDLMPVGAAVSITFYPGHNEGLNEMEKITPFIKDLNSKSFTVSTHEWINRNKAPVLSLILKTN